MSEPRRTPIEQEADLRARKVANLLEEWRKANHKAGEAEERLNAAVDAYREIQLRQHKEATL